MFKVLAWLSRWDGPKANPVGEASNASFDEDNAEGDSEASTRAGTSDDGRKKFFRKTRKKSKSPTHDRRRDSTSSDETDVDTQTTGDRERQQASVARSVATGGATAARPLRR